MLSMAVRFHGQLLHLARPLRGCHADILRALVLRDGWCVHWPLLRVAVSPGHLSAMGRLRVGAFLGLFLGLAEVGLLFVARHFHLHGAVVDNITRGFQSGWAAHFFYKGLTYGLYAFGILFVISMLSPEMLEKKAAESPASCCEEEEKAQG